MGAVLTAQERATILDAADELDALAADIRACHTTPPSGSWEGEREAEAEYNSLNRLVRRLRKLHARALRAA